MIHGIDFRDNIIPNANYLWTSRNLARFRDKTPLSVQLSSWFSRLLYNVLAIKMLEESTIIYLIPTSVNILHYQRQ